MAKDKRGETRRNGSEPARASNGSGYLVLHQGIWVARWKIGSKVIQRSLHTADRAEAETKLAQLSAPRTGMRDREAVRKLTRAMSARLDDVSDQVRVASIPISQLYDLWFASPVRGRATGRTLDSYRHQIAAFRDWLSRRYPEITNARDVSQVVAEEYIAFRKSSRASGTVSKDLNLLAAVWRSLSLRFGLEYNPWTPEKIARPASKPFSRRALTDEECDALLAVADETQRLRILLALDAGLRLGDVIRLKWSSIDFKRKIIDGLRTLKTGAQIFNPISKRLSRALKKRRAAQPPDEEFVFPEDVLRLRDNGDPESVTHEMILLFRRAGIKVNEKGEDGRTHTLASYHSLRHTFVSRLISRGVNPYFVQKAVGHSTMLMTAHYDHSAAEEIRQALDGQFKPACISQSRPPSRSSARRSSRSKSGRR